MSIILTISPNDMDKFSYKIDTERDDKLDLIIEGDLNKIDTSRGPNMIGRYYQAMLKIFSSKWYKEFVRKGEKITAENKENKEENKKESFIIYIRDNQLARYVEEIPDSFTMEKNPYVFKIIELKKKHGFILKYNYGWTNEEE